MSDPVDAMHEHGIELHPDADKLDLGSWEEPGHCICGQALPAQKEWHDAGRDWSHVRCIACRTMYVDEGEFFLIYDAGDDKTRPCCQREEGPEGVPYRSDISTPDTAPIGGSVRSEHMETDRTS